MIERLLGRDLASSLRFRFADEVNARFGSIEHLRLDHHLHGVLKRFPSPRLVSTIFTALARSQGPYPGLVSQKRARLEQHVAAVHR